MEGTNAMNTTEVANGQPDSTSSSPQRRQLGLGRRVVLGLALSAVVGTSSGCNRYGWELFGAAVELAAYVAVTAAVLSWHDRHHHYDGCGHQFVVYDSRPVYSYGGHWEYYDDRADTWYYYPDGVPGY